MKGQYYAVVRAGGSDELTHWKYIKKVKTKSGKTRYIYDVSELKKYESGVTEKRQIRMVRKRQLFTKMLMMYLVASLPLLTIIVFMVLV